MKGCGKISSPTTYFSFDFIRLYQIPIGLAIFYGYDNIYDIPTVFYRKCIEWFYPLKKQMLNSILIKYLAK